MLSPFSPLRKTSSRQFYYLLIYAEKEYHSHINLREDKLVLVYIFACLLKILSGSNVPFASMIGRFVQVRGSSAAPGAKPTALVFCRMVC
jgi:hypothetical protein